MTVALQNDYVEFNGKFWRPTTGGPTIPTPLYGTAATLRLHGRMSLWRNDVAVFRTDDGRTFTFGPIGYGCA